MLVFPTGSANATAAHPISANRPIACKRPPSAARALADSVLVKTMFYGRQPHWGRLAQALGACGVRFNPRRVVIRVGGTVAVRGGICIAPRFDMLTTLAEPEVAVDVDLQGGRHAARVLTCDLSEQYVKINAGYLS